MQIEVTREEYAALKLALVHSAAHYQAKANDYATLQRIEHASPNLPMYVAGYEVSMKLRTLSNQLFDRI